MKRYSTWFIVLLVVLLLPVTAFAEDGDTSTWRTTLDDIISVLQALIPLTATPRIIHCLGAIAMDAEQESNYKRRLKNLLIFVVVAECAVSFLKLIYRYFS